MTRMFRSVLAAAALALASIVALSTPVHAQAMSNYLENKLIDHVFRGVSFTAPTTLYIGLATTSASDTGCGTEVAGSNYSRAQLNPSTTNWASTGGAGTTTNPSAGTGGQTSNNSTITFATPSGSWGTVTTVCVFDASTSGNLIFYTNLTTSKTINSGDTVSFAAGALTFTIDN
jgi:hypothetical protein